MLAFILCLYFVNVRCKYIYIYIEREKCHNWASQMAQWVKALPELTWKVKLNGKVHMKVDGENWLFKVVLQTLYMDGYPTHTSQIHCNNNPKFSCMLYRNQTKKICSYFMWQNHMWIYVEYCAFYCTKLSLIFSLLSVTVIKPSQQKLPGEKRIVFTLYFIVHYWGS